MSAKIFACFFGGIADGHLIVHFCQNPVCADRFCLLDKVAKFIILSNTKPQNCAIIALMKKLERILNNLEKVISAFGLALLGMISYLFVNAENLTLTKLVILWVGMVLACAVIAVLCLWYNKYLNQLKED